MKLDEIKDLMTFLEKSKLKKISLKKGDFELHLEKESFEGPLVLPSKSIAVPVVKEEVASSEKKKEAPGVFVKSPMVGTFYSAASPDQPPFVKKGDVVHENTIVCIIEAMKVMNEIKAGVNGVIAETFCSNAQPVEFGSKLFRIE